MSVDDTPAPEAVARRRAEHERELSERRRWRIAVTTTAFGLLGFYLFLLYGIRVMELFYLIVNLLAIATGLCNVIVYRVFQLPTILAELPRLSEPQRRINLAAIAPERAELLGRVLPGLHLARTREEAAALDDDELVRRLAGLQWPDWRKIGRACLIAWLIVASTTLAGVLLYRPEHGIPLFERLQGKQAPIDKRWSPL